MSSFINKAKDKIEQTLERRDNKADDPRSSNAGPHSSNVMNKADPMVDSDRDHRNDPTSRVGGYNNTQLPDQHGTTGGAGGFATSDTYGSRTTDPGYDNPRSTNTGPHSSNLMNKLDPRHDSDRDGRNDPTSRVGGVGNTQQYGDGYGQTGGPGGIASTDTGYGHSGHGEHRGQSGLAGAVGHTGGAGYGEPTSHTGNVGHQHVGHTGGPGYGESVGHSGSTGYTEPVGHQHAGHVGSGTGLGGISGSHTGTSNTYDDPRSSNTGPHRSNLMNKLDPRTDSDNDNRNDPTSRVGGYGTQGESYGHPGGNQQGYTGTGNTYDDPRSGNAGPHKSNLVNRMDPRVDSDRDHRNDPASRVGGYGTQESYGHPGGVQEGYTGSGTTGGYGTQPVGRSHGGYDDSSYTPGSGNANKTAGPHDSNILNKLDPRVDSDMDGSKTYGGNQTHR